MEFRELSGDGWKFIKPLPPPKARTGRPRVDDRVVLNGILCYWLPLKTVWDRFKRWSRVVEGL